MRNDSYNSKNFRNLGTGDRDGSSYSNYRNLNSRQGQGSTAQSFDALSPTNRNFNQSSGYNPTSQGYYNSSSRSNITGNASSSKNSFYNPSLNSPSANAKVSPSGTKDYKLANNRDQPLPGRQQFRTLPHQDVPKSYETSPQSLEQGTSSAKELRFSPPPNAAVRQLPTHRVPSHAKPPTPRQQQSSVGSYYTSPPPKFNNGQPPLPPKPPSPLPPLPNDAPPPEVPTIQNQYVRYNEAPPYRPAILTSFTTPPPPILPTHVYMNNSKMGLLPPRPSLFAQPQAYIQPRSFLCNQSLRLNSYKRKSIDSDMDLRKNNKKRKKPLSQITPLRKDWSVQEAQRALEVEQECNKRARRQSLIIKFPDLELNRDIVSRFHTAIENVHFQQPSTARFCFVTLRGSADPETVIKELNRTKFGQGYLLAEVKKDREDDLAIGPEDIDPMTLYVGNLAQDVTKEAMMRTFPNNKRIDIGYAKKMKYTRYAFVSFTTVDLAIEAFKKTHNTQMHSKSLIVRFRRLHGTVGMPGEPKTPLPSRSESSIVATTTSESETDPQNSPWNSVDVSGWLPDSSVKTEPSECTDDEYDYYDCQEKLDDQYYEPETQNMSYDYDDSSEDIKPQLSILQQRAQDDNRNVTEDVDQRDLTTAETILGNTGKTGEEQLESSVSNEDDAHMLVPKTFVEVVKRNVCETALEGVQSSSKTASNVTKNKVTSSISVKNHDKVSESRQSTRTDEPNMALHKPFVELVKRELRDEQTNNDKNKKLSSGISLKENVRDLIPKPIIEEKPRIDTDPSISYISLKENSTTGNQSMRMNVKPIVETKPKIDFATDGKPSTSSNKSNKEGAKTDQILEQIADVIDTLWTEVPRPLILLPEVKAEPMIKDLNNHNMSNDDNAIRAKTKLVVHKPKIEVKKESIDDKESHSETSIEDNPRDLVPKPLIEVKQENIDYNSDRSESLVISKDLEPESRVELKNKGNNGNEVNSEMLTDSRDLVPKPKIEVKKENNDDHANPETSVSTGNNGHSIIPKPFIDVKKEKLDVNYEMQLNHELMIDDDKSILHESDDPSTQ